MARFKRAFPGRPYIHQGPSPAQAPLGTVGPPRPFIARDPVPARARLSRGTAGYPGPFNTNPTFQANVASWTPFNGTFTQSGTVAYPGQAFSGLITPTGGFTQAYVQSEQEPVTTGRLYTVACWVYSSAGWAAGAQVNINWFDASHNYLSTSAPAATPGPRRDLDAAQLHGSSTRLRRVRGMCGGGKREPAVHGAAVPVRRADSDCPAVPVHAGRHRHCRRRYRLPGSDPGRVAPYQGRPFIFRSPAGARGRIGNAAFAGDGTAVPPVPTPPAITLEQQPPHVPVARLRLPSRHPRFRSRPGHCHRSGPARHDHRG